MNILNPKSLTSIAIPLTLVGIQGILRFGADADFSGIGITLSSIGIGQIFPFIVLETLLIGKIYGLNEKIHDEDGTLVTRHNFEIKANPEKIKEIRLFSNLLFLINLLLFCCTIVFNLKGQMILHILTGALSCFLAWYYIIKY